MIHVSVCSWHFSFNNMTSKIFLPHLKTQDDASLFIYFFLEKAGLLPKTSSIRKDIFHSHGPSNIGKTRLTKTSASKALRFPEALQSEVGGWLLRKEVQ